MAWRVVLGPLWMAVLLGAWVAAVAYGRREAWSRWPRWPFALGCAALFLAALAAGSLGVGGLVAEVVWRKAAGGGVLVGAALLAFFASRSRARAALLLTQAPLNLDEAVARIRAGRPPAPGVFTGRIGASEPVASPGGIVCALYDAELREPSPGKTKGPLLSVDRAAAGVIYVRGERCRARVAFAEGSLWATPEPRRCRVDGRLSWAQGTVLASGVAPMEVVSHEKVARLGGPCAVVGRLDRGLTEGTYVLKGPQGGPALLVLGEELAAPARRLFGRAWALFGASAGLCVLGAWLIAP
jgi:hypothetical protein